MFPLSWVQLIENRIIGFKKCHIFPPIGKKLLFDCNTDFEDLKNELCFFSRCDTPFLNRKPAICNSLKITGNFHAMGPISLIGSVQNAS
ncbi:MAG: hypothetical protein CBD43_02860 [Gammaproteobacteria bacterium TMED183]|nr:hypothetical protein [SAR116 cluster bacterium]OUW37043.1 MAG: hypothetical protein CBD43_02860 [Gammaproteobacteria bacterium TMED183]